MIELKIKYGPSDYTDFNRASIGIGRILRETFKRSFLWFGIISGVIAWLMVIGTTFLDIDGQIVEPSTFSKFLAFSVVFLLFFLLLVGCTILVQYLFGGPKTASLQKGLDPNVRILIDEHGIDAYVGEFIREIYDWRAVKDVYDTKKQLIIFISDFRAIIIPKRIFETEKDIQNCWNFILKCHNASSRVVLGAEATQIAK